MLPHRLQFEFRLTPELIVDVARDADTPRLREFLNAVRDIDAIAEQIAPFDDHIADIDADAELEPVFLGDRDVA